MSLSCMELQLDQWLLTKGRSSAGRLPSMFHGGPFSGGGRSRGLSHLCGGTFPRSACQARKDPGL